MRTPEEETIFRWLWAAAKVAVKLWFLNVALAIVFLIFFFGLHWITGGFA